MPVGIILRIFKHQYLIYDAHEIYGYLAYLPTSLGKMILRIEQLLLKLIDHLIVINENFYKYYNEYVSTNITILMNCKSIVDINRESVTNTSKFTICYFGGFHNGRMVPDLCEIISHHPEFQLLIGGSGPELNEILAIINKNKYNNIEFHGFVKPSKIPYYNAISDVIFAVYNPTILNNRLSVPNKLFEALIAGRPIIVAKGSYAGDFVDKYECGISIDYTYDALEKALRFLFENPEYREELGENGFKLAKERFNWDLEKQKLLALYV